MKKIVVILTLFIAFHSALAQDKGWTLNECMQYALDNSPKVKQRTYESDNYEADYVSSLGAFLPSIGAGIGANFSFGRNINPEDNTYKNVNTFNNPYSLSGSLPLFYAGQYINQWRQAKTNRLLGKTNEQATKDDLAMTTMQSFMDVIYYQGMINLAKEKLEESKRTYYRTMRMEELGLKSKADVAQMEAQMAGDDYSLTYQENLYNLAMSTLKENMNYPFEDELVIDTLVTERPYLPILESIESIYEYAREHNPLALQKEYQLKSTIYQKKRVKGTFFPTLYMSAGVSTNYYDVLNSESTARSFSNQFNNNRGQYVNFTMSIPIFDGFNKLSNLRRARNNVRIAAESQNETLRQIQTTIEKNVLDREGCVKEIIQMKKQVEASELAHRQTLRKYEEGLMSSLDVQTSSNNLVQAKANLLHRKLTYIIKSKIVDYYKGIPLIEE